MKKFTILITLMLLIPLKVKAISTNATSAILMDMDSNRILYSKNIHEKRLVASISKIMTAVVVLENNNINKKITIGNEISTSHGSGIYIKKGEKLKIRDLLYGLILRSGNDAALALAYHTTKNVDDFVELMNKEALKIGMKNSEFNNPSGLDDEEKGNYSSAYDMAVLMSHAYQKKAFREIIKTQKYNLKTNKNTYIWYNKNKLLKTYEYATGGKTGFTKKARRTLVTTASKNNTNLVVVTLNDGSDWLDHEKLFEYGFLNYQSYTILKKGFFSINQDNYYNKYKFYLKKNFKYPLLDSEKNNIILKIKLEKKRHIKNNIKVGNVEVYVGDDLIHKEAIFITKRKIKKSSLKEWFKL